MKLAAGAFVASAVPITLRPPAARAGDIGIRGYCPGLGIPDDPCPDNTVEIPWTTVCGSDADFESYVFPSANKSTFNGCGPESGIDLKILGKHEPPDNPLGLADFASACNGHDCCYGSCGQAKADCDATFIEGMSGACDTSATSLLSGIGLLYCQEIAAVYFAAVAGGGADAYLDAQREACKCCKSPCADCDQKILAGQANLKCCGDTFQCLDVMGSDKNNCGDCGTVCADYFGYNSSVDQTAICCNGGCTPARCGCNCVEPTECCATAEAGQFVCCPNGCYNDLVGAHYS